MVVAVVEEEEEEVGSSEVGSVGKVSLSKKVVLVLLAVEAGAVKEGSWFLPSRWVLGHAIKAGAVKASSGSRQVRVLEACQSHINLVSGRHSVHDRCGRSSRHGSSWF